MTITRLSLLFATVLTLACGGGYPPTPDGGRDAAVLSILGSWSADPVAGGHESLVMSGDETSGTFSLDQTSTGFLPGCVSHSFSEGTFTRSGNASGDLQLAPTSGQAEIEFCDDPANDRASAPLTAEQLLAGRSTGTYELTESTLVAHFTYPDIGTVVITFTRST